MWREQAIIRVISSGDLYCCLLPRCEALRTSRSEFPIATLPYITPIGCCFRSLIGTLNAFVHGSSTTLTVSRFAFLTPQSNIWLQSREAQTKLIVAGQLVKDKVVLLLLGNLKTSGRQIGRLTRALATTRLAPQLVRSLKYAQHQLPTCKLLFTVSDTSSVAEQIYKCFKCVKYLCSFSEKFSVIRAWN